MQFFSELPLPLKDLLESVYVISDCLYEEIPDGSVWEHVHKQWTGKSQEERIRSIAQYLYHHRRNPYTHRAKAAPPRETRDWRQTMPEEWSSKSGDFDTAYDPLRDVAREGDKYRIVRFRGEPREDESLLLRLAVAIACLRKLAYATDAKYVQGFRRYQIRREIMYLSMREMDIVFEMLRYYNGENQEHPLYSPLQWLPVFPLAEIRKLRPYLRTDTTLERGIDKRIQEYLGRLARVSTSIKTFNKAHFPQGRLFPLSQPEVTRKARAETYAAIRDMAELRGLAEVMHNIYRWLDDLADRIIW